MLQHYYALFEMPPPSGAGGRLGLATRGDCTPGTDDAESGPASYCRARGESCSQCVGPVDDLTQHRGYCVWCPATSMCTAADPKSMVSPCLNAMGFSAHGLDNAQGGRCPDLTTAQTGCQTQYQRVTALVMLGGILGSCSSDAQDSIDQFVAQCDDVQIRIHISGHSQAVAGATCALSVMKNSPHVHGMKQCSVPTAAALCTAQTDSCASARDGHCDTDAACVPGTDAADCYGAPVVPSGGEPVLPCISGVDAINVACPSLCDQCGVPDSCPPACATVFDPWYSRCQHDDFVTGLQSGMFDLAAFGKLCSSGGGHR